MSELDWKEEQWLRAFAKEDEFFFDLLEDFERNDFLSKRQDYRLVEEIEMAENRGDNVLSEEELKYLKKEAENDDDLNELLEIYEEVGYFDEFEYDGFKIRYKFKK